MTERIHPALPSRPPRVRRWAALWLVPTLLVGTASAEPFVIEAMPAGFNGAAIADGLGAVAPNQGNAPVAVDFNGDGQPSWYAGGTTIAHPKTPTVFDPERYQIATLPSISLPVCPVCTARPLAFAVADVNRDGRPDIMRVNEWNGHSYAFTFQVFLGDGDNTFTLGWRHDWDQAPGFNSGERYFQLALADFDRDGDPDLAVHSTYEYTNWDADPNRDQGSLQIRWNQSGGNFDTSTVLQSQHLRANGRMIVADVDGDGDADVSAGFSSTWAANDTYTYTHHFFDNDGGTFTTRDDGLVDGAWGFPDINRDGWPDYVFLGFSGGCGANVCLRLNDGSGNLDSAWYPYSAYAGGRYPPAAAFGDFDEDGRPDFITAEGAAVGTSTRLTLHRGQTDTSAGSSETLATMASNIVHFGVGDARGDADLDLLMRLADGSFHLVRNTAQRLKVRAAASENALTLSGATRLAAFDGNRDGIDDLFALRPAGPRIHRALGDGAGAFAAAETKTLDGAASDFTHGDFDRDGRNDLAYVVPDSGEVHLLRQTNPLFAIWNDTTIANYPGAALVEAGQGALLDGTLDLAVASNTTGGLRWLRNIGGAVSWTATTPRASFAVMPTDLVLIPWFSVFGDTAVTCGDGSTTFSIDGYSNLLGWYRSISLSGSLVDPMPGVCFATNMDFDADLELVFQTTQGELWFWDPNGTGTGPFFTLDDSPEGNIQTYATVDWNRDGLDDLLVGTNLGLYLYTREGINEFWSRHDLKRYTDVLDVAVLDANRDSRPDAAILTSSAILWVPNQSEIVDATALAVPLPHQQTIKPGASADVVGMEIVNPGRGAEDASIAVTGVRLQFRKATPNGSSWTMGATMTAAEVQQAVASVQLRVNGSLVGIANASAVAADGSLQINYTPGLGGVVVPIPADQSMPLKLRVELKPTAGNASFTTFYAVIETGDNTARVLNGNSPTGRSGSFAYQDPNLIIIDNTLFRDGFESSP